MPTSAPEDLPSTRTFAFAFVAASYELSALVRPRIVPGVTAPSIVPRKKVDCFSLSLRLPIGVHVTPLRSMSAFSVQLEVPPRIAVLFPSVDVRGEGQQ